MNYFQFVKILSIFQLKKLVYVYLVRYAEEQQDLALLSISTFQRALKDPNQLIRASALRVLSSIRVQMIAPVMLLALKDCVRDMSPYVISLFIILRLNKYLGS
jgi:AP-3 complex subunit beta